MLVRDHVGVYTCTCMDLHVSVCVRMFATPAAAAAAAAAAVCDDGSA